MQRHGCPPELIAKCDAVVRLPCRGVKNSMNVGVAFGMCGYEIARQWSRAMWFTTEEDWMDWISAGEKRNPYIPSRPDEAYRDQWISWTDFLNGPIEE